MQFYNSSILMWLWALIPFAIFLFYVRKVKEKRLAAFIHAPLIDKIPSDHSPKKETLRILVWLLFFVFSFITLARPQWGEQKKKLQRKGIDIIFCVDTSLSMLAEDVKPNRFEKSRLMMDSFSKKLKGDRIGLVTFAGSSFLSCPLTLDTAAFKLFLDAVQVGFNPDPGSDVADALNTCIKAFPDDNHKHQAIVLFSDGDDHATDTLEVAKKAAEKGIRIYTIGVGTAKGEVIPLKDERGRRVGLKKDRQGQIVTTQMNADRLQAIAKATDGLYFQATGGEKELDLIYQDMQKMGQKQFKEQTITEREDRFEIFLVIALALFLLEFLIGERKKLAI